LEGLFLIAKRALAAPNLNIEESHTDFMSFRDDGGIMLAPKGIQEYVPALYLARLLTHFAKMPVILSIGGITDTHKIGLVKVPSDDSVRAWLKKTLRDFDYLEHKLVNRQGDLIVHGPSGTSAVYQETQSEIEKAHQAVTRIYPYAVRAVHDLTGTWLDELEINSATPTERIETLLIMQGSLYPNAAEALEELEEKGWSGMACISVRCFNPFPEEKLFAWFNMAQRIVVLDRSNSFGSIPPLASRILSSLARFTSCQPASAGKQLRILVGGLGGREITVAEMKEIFLSTHLLFVPPQEWEAALIREWLEQDPILRAMLQEAAALDLRNTNRHTRVPTHLRYQRDQDEEFEARTQMLKRFLSAKNYTAFLAAYQQVEFVGQREILQESTLLQQVVLYVEIRLARHGIESGQADKRHALLLLRYGREQSDRDLAKRYLEENPKEAEDLSAALMSSYGVAAGSPIYGQRIEDAGGLVPRAAEAIELTSQESRPQSNVTAVDSVPSPQPQYSSEEAQQIEELLTQMVTLQGEEPLFYNPEDFEHELVSRLQKETGSALFELNKRCLPAEAEELLLNFRHLYRDTIDRTLHREILAQHHAPELRELFEGEGMKRLTELVEGLNEMLQAEPLEKRQKTIARELERYLEERCLPGLPKNPSFYLEYYRDWVVPGLLQID
jgi:pyruvate/2-oxoacid:ferredoxin oxidoreductase alpha subunit